MRYDDGNRGQFQHKSFARKLVLFRGLQYGDITPTDIDGIIDYKNVCFILFEFKFQDAPVPYGQWLCLKRLSDNISRSGKMAVLMICDHNSEGDIIAKDATVRELYFNGRFYPQFKGMSVKDVTDRIIKKAEMICQKSV